MRLLIPKENAENIHSHIQSEINLFLQRIYGQAVPENQMNQNDHKIVESIFQNVEYES